MPPRILTLGFDDTKTAPSPMPKKTQKLSSSTTRVRNKGLSLKTLAQPSDGDLGEDDNEASLKKEPILATSGDRKKRPYSMIEEEVADPQESVGLDLGMTHSAISRVPVEGDPKDVRVITEWPGTFENRDKVPSLIARASENSEDDFGDRTLKFGYEVTAGMNIHAYLKQEFSQNEVASRHDDPILTGSAGQLLIGEPAGNTTREDSIAYLKSIRDAYMERSRRDTMESVFERMRRNVIISHPNNSSEQNKAKLVSAAKAAGFGNGKHDKIITMSEGEAAVLGAFAYASQKGQQNFFTLNTNVITMDIGGLTQDAATFLVKRVGKGIKLEQVCIARGGKCGAVTVFCRFYELCLEWFGDDFSSLSKSQTGPGSEFLQSFERAMRRFTVKDTAKNISLRLYMNRVDDERYEGGDVILTGIEMASMIDEMLTYSFSILTEQFSEAKVANNKPAMTVVLSGGVSLCRYVEDRIRDFCSTKLHPDMSVVRPDDAWSLVVRGAAIHGLKKPIVESRVAKAYLGVSGHRRYEPTEDDDADHICPIYGERVMGAMAWHVKKNEKIKPNTKHPVKAYIVLQPRDLENLELFKGVIPLYSYAGDRKPPPASVGDNEVRPVGEIPVDLSKISRHAKTQLERQSRTNEPGELKLTIEQTLNSESGLMEFIIKAGKTRIGRFPLRHEHTKAALGYEET